MSCNTLWLVNTLSCQISISKRWKFWASFKSFSHGAFTLSYNIVSCSLKRYSFCGCYRRSSLIDTFMALKIVTTTMAINYPRSGEIISFSLISILYFATTLGGNLRKSCCYILRTSPRISTLQCSRCHKHRKLNKNNNRLVHALRTSCILHLWLLGIYDNNSQHFILYSLLHVYCQCAIVHVRDRHHHNRHLALTTSLLNIKRLCSKLSVCWR